MLSFICIADVHFTARRPQYRTDNWVETQLGKFKFILDQAKKHDAVILCAGDLLDKSPIKPELLNNIMFLIQGSGVKILSVPGQHDQSFHNPDMMKSNYGTLSISGHITDIGDSRICTIGASVYGKGWGDEYPKPDSVDDINILLAHDTVTEGTPPPWLTAKTAEQMIEENHGFDYIVTGDFHEKFVVKHNGCTLINTGPMLRDSIDKRDFKPACWLINDEGVTEIPIPVEDDVFDMDAVKSAKTVCVDNEYERMFEDFLNSLGHTGEKPSFEQIVTSAVSSLGSDKQKLKDEIMEVLDYVKQD
jgi:DNA repair exonuclease SbcCD nuclease subunit